MLNNLIKSTNNESASEKGELRGQVGAEGVGWPYMFLWSSDGNKKRGDMRANNEAYFVVSIKKRTV